MQRAFDWTCARPWRVYAVLSVLALVFFLPGIASIPPLDRDEPRFAQASKQMLETGDFVDIRFLDGPRHKKPVGIYWLQAATTSVLGTEPWTEIWTYRVPSQIGAIAAVLLTAAIGKVLFGPVTGFIAGLLMLACVLLNVEARIAKTDAALLATILAAQVVLARAWMATARTAQRTVAPPGPGLAAVFWIALAASILIKGPVGPMVVGLTGLAIAAAGRRIDFVWPLRPLWGLPLLVAIALPWFVAIYLITDGAFYAESVGKDMLGKVSTGQERHWGPPGYHLVAMLLAFWPVTLVLPLAAVWAWHKRADAAVTFCLAWAIPTFLVFEAVATKLPHYPLPTYPALACLIGASLATTRGDGPAPARRGIAGWTGTVLFTLIGLVLAVAMIGLGVAGMSGPVAVLVAAGACALVLVVNTARVWLAAAAPASVLTSLVLTAFVLLVGVFAAALPGLDRIWLSPKVAAAVAEAPCERPRVGMSGFAEPSAVFLIGTHTEPLSDQEIAPFVAAEGCRVLIIDTERKADHLPANGLASARRGTPIVGTNINGGDELVLTPFYWAAPE